MANPIENIPIGMNTSTKVVVSVCVVTALALGVLGGLSHFIPGINVISNGLVATSCFYGGATLLTASIAFSLFRFIRNHQFSQPSEPLPPDDPVSSGGSPSFYEEPPPAHNAPPSYEGPPPAVMTRDRASPMELLKIEWLED